MDRYNETFLFSSVMRTNLSLVELWYVMVATSTVVINRSKLLRGEKPGNNQQPQVWQDFSSEKTQISLKGGEWINLDLDKLGTLLNTKVDFGWQKDSDFEGLL